MNIIKNIPNYITCINLLFGCFGLIYLVSGDLQTAAICIWIAALCDFLDGFAARAVKAESALGKELDSLADVVSFGVLPAFIWFYYVLQSIAPGAIFIKSSEVSYWPYVALIMAMCSAWRLAKFNIDTRQSDHFIGVPTPANALVWSAFPFISSNSIFPWAVDVLQIPAFIIVFGLMMSFLLVSNLPLIAFKFKSWSWAVNKVKYSFLIAAILSLVTMKANGVFFVFFAYLIASLIENKKKA